MWPISRAHSQATTEFSQEVARSCPFPQGIWGAGPGHCKAKGFGSVRERPWSHGFPDHLPRDENTKDGLSPGLVAPPEHPPWSHSRGTIWGCGSDPTGCQTPTALAAAPSQLPLAFQAAPLPPRSTGPSPRWDPSGSPPPWATAHPTRPDPPLGSRGVAGPGFFLPPSPLYLGPLPNTKHRFEMTCGCRSDRNNVFWQRFHFVFFKNAT